MSPRRRRQLEQAVSWCVHRRPDREASPGFVKYGTLIVAVLAFVYTVLSTQEQRVLDGVRRDIDRACACCLVQPANQQRHP
jgi:hypothetical protein